MRQYILHSVFVFFIGYFVQAQEILSLEDAVKITFENNYDIKIAKNNLKVGSTNNSYANAGMLPLINANFTNNNSQLNTSQTQADGTVRQLDGAKNMNLNYGVGLDWTIFDGLSMFAKKEQLNVLETQGKAALQLAILTKISDVYATYFDLVQHQHVIASIDTAIAISSQRLSTAQNRFSIGKSSKLEVLNAQVDLNSDLSLLLKQKEQYRISKIRMNELMARDLKIDFKVNDRIELDKSMDLKVLQLAAESQNPTLQFQILSKKLAELNLKQVKGNRYPRVRVTSGYNFTESEASLGFITQSSGKGFVYGINATVPVFNSFLQHKNEKVARFQIENAELALEQQKLNLKTQLSILFESYQTNLKLVEVEEKNVEIAKQNIEITLAKFKIGTITTIEFRTAQQNYVEAIVRYSNAQYLTKLTEINLNELAGTLKLN